MVVKKYGNRRLYDTTESRYITLEELAERVRAGETVQVLDAKTHKDLTQQTLAHLILESRGASKLLPVPLLEQLIRMGDDHLAEFFGLYLTGALEVYLAARRGAQGVMAYAPPFAQLPFSAGNAFARLLGGWSPGGWSPGSWAPGNWPGANWSAGGSPPSGSRPSGWGPEPAPPPRAEPEPTPEPPPKRAPRAAKKATADDTADQVAALRKELEAIKRAMRRDE